MAKDSDKPVLNIEKLKARPKERRQSPNLASTYSNSMNVEVSFNDFKLFFGEIVEASEEKLVTEDRVAVIMGPEETKAVAKVLAKQIEVYEGIFGAIRVPPGDSD